MIQDKLTTEQKLIKETKKVDDEMCQLCSQQQTSEHIIISYLYKQDIWIEVVKTFIASPNNILAFTSSIKICLN
jgi:hypothetical protein